jgi:hypothetical protein
MIKGADEEEVREQPILKYYSGINLEQLRFEYGN